MSLRVGESFLFPDDTLQETAGVIPQSPRDFYFTPQGNPSNPGDTSEQPLDSPEDAYALTAALDPIPQPLFPASINASQTGAFGTSGVAPLAYVASNCGDASLIAAGDGEIVYTTAEGQNIRYGAFIHGGDNGICHLIEDCSRVLGNITTLVTGPFFGLPTNNTSALVFRGIIDDVFHEGSVIEGRSENASVILFEAETVTPPSISRKVVTLFNDNQIALDFNPPNATDVATFSFDSLAIDQNSPPSGCSAIRGRNGKCIAHAKYMTIPGGVYVEDGAKVVFNGGDWTDGDIYVEAGGELNMIWPSFDFTNVTMTLLGTADLLLQGRKFGAYVDGSEGFISWFSPDTIDSDWETLSGTVSLTATSLDDLQASWTKTGFPLFNSTLEFRLIDVDSSDVYFSGSDTQNAPGDYTFDLTASVAWPGGTRRVSMEVRRTAGARRRAGNAQAGLSYTV